MSDIEFIDGLFIKEPVTKDGKPLPDFIKAKGSMKVAELIGWLNTQESEWVNFNVKVSKAGKWYVAVDNWTPTKDEEYDKGLHQAKAAMAPAEPDLEDPDIPFS